MNTISEYTPIVDIHDALNEYFRPQIVIYYRVPTRDSRSRQIEVRTSDDDVMSKLQ